VRECLLGTNDLHLSQPLTQAQVLRVARELAPLTGQRTDFMSMADVRPKKLEWLYEPYMPLAAVTVISGRPGVGKSGFTTALASALTRGQSVPWSDSCPKGRVLVFSAEDDPATIQRPRHDAYQSDVTQVFLPSELFPFDEKGLARLSRAMAEYEPRSL